MELAAALTELTYAKDWTPASRAWYASRLGAFVAWARDHGITELESLTAPLIRRYVDKRRTTPGSTGKPLDSHTLHGHVRAIRALLHWAVAEGLIDANVPKRVALPKREQKVLSVLSSEHISRLYHAAQSTTTPARDAAILSLLLDTGCRASELCGLTLDAVTFTADTAWLLVHGKGREQREVALGRKARQDLHRYLYRARRAPSAERRIFLGKQGPLTPGGLDRLLYRLRDKAGAQHFQGVAVAAHRFRHTHAVMALEAGTDVYVLSRQMGHSDVTTTGGYLKALSARRARQLAPSVLDRLKA
jgi:site-specific recombinase XerD